MECALSASARTLAMVPSHACFKFPEHWNRAGFQRCGRVVRIVKPDSASVRIDVRRAMVASAESRERRPSDSSSSVTDGGDSSLGIAGFSGRMNASSSALLVSTALLALGVGLSLSKPAFAKSVDGPPIVTATIDERGEVKVEEGKLETTDEEFVKDNEDMEGEEEITSEMDDGEETFEPPFGEGSDLTNDPTEVLLRSYLERHPTDMKALEALLYSRLKKGQVNAALPVLEKLTEIEPDQLEWKFMKAQAHEFVGNLDQAQQGFEGILEKKPLSARAFQGLVGVMQKNGEDEQSLKILGEAVKKAEDEGQKKEATNLRMLLGQMLTVQGNLDGAMEQYRTVVEDNPQDFRPYLCQGLVYSIIGEEAEAEKQFRRYRKLCPKDFPHRGFLDELMLNAKNESRKLNERLKKEEEFKAKGKTLPKPMRQPLATGTTSKEENVNN